MGTGMEVSVSGGINKDCCGRHRMWSIPISHSSAFCSVIFNDIYNPGFWLYQRWRKATMCVCSFVFRLPEKQAWVAVERSRTCRDSLEDGKQERRWEGKKCGKDMSRSWLFLSQWPFLKKREHGQILSLNVSGVRQTHPRHFHTAIYLEIP